MGRNASGIPSYRFHRPSGQAVVTLNGQDIYLGIHDTPQSKAEYDRVISQWIARGRRLVSPDESSKAPLIEDVILGYYGHCVATKPDVEVEKVKAALKPVRKLYGNTKASAFNAMSYATIRMKMVESGLGVNTIRGRLSVIRRMIAWGIAREMVPDKVLNLIKALEQAEPLSVGKVGGAKPPKRIKPVPEDHIKAILPHLNPTVRAMVELQALTGMRPGEVWRMTTGQIERTGDEWIYRPTKHKTQHHGKDRTIPLGPKAQEVLKPLLKASPDAPLFSPRDAYERAHDESKRVGRTRSSKRGKRPQFKETYNKGSYATAVARGCIRAGLPVFRPNQIRHAYATRVRREFGLEAAQVLLGHSRADVTQVYAETNLAKAAEVARKIG
jgi:integrase